MTNTLSVYGILDWLLNQGSIPWSITILLCICQIVHLQFGANRLFIA
jgi:hypothetical protein